MLKKTLAIGAALVLTTSVAAATPAPYIGASVGINTNTSNNTTNGAPGYYRGVPIKVFAGYGGEVSDSIYLAAELIGTAVSGEISNQGQMRSTYGYGISLIPGVELSDHTMIYARAGFVRTRFSNVMAMTSGGEFGIGLQTALTQNVDVRGEYDYTAYRDVGGISAPHSDAFDLGVIYKF